MSDWKISDLIKTAIMNVLEERVAELGVCPSCHKKTLGFVHEAEGMRFYQCAGCLKVYVLNKPSSAASGERQEG